MGKLGRIGLVLWLCLPACSREREPQQHSAGARPPATASAVAPRQRAEPLYDAQGRLLPGDRKFYWLRLPRGFSPSKLSRPRHPVFEAVDIPTDKVRAYLAQHMFTGEVEELGRGAIYRAVMPIEGTDNSERFDVTVVENGPRELLLRFDLRSYPGIKPLPVEQAKAALARERSQAE